MTDTKTSPAKRNCDVQPSLAPATCYAHVPKPRYKSPCNHCGICCQLSLCHIAELAFPNQKAPCPALCVGVDGSLCGLVMMEEATGINPVIRKSLGIGVGCSMPDEDTTQSEIEAFDRYAHGVVYGHNASGSAAGDQKPPK